MKTRKHGLTGQRNAKKERTKSGRIAVRCYPEIKDKARAAAAAMALSVSDYIELLIVRATQ